MNPDLFVRYFISYFDCFALKLSDGQNSCLMRKCQKIWCMVIWSDFGSELLGCTENISAQMMFDLGILYTC